MCIQIDHSLFRYRYRRSHKDLARICFALHEDETMNVNRIMNGKLSEGKDEQEEEEKVK